ncbi:MAG: hypothetical protein M3P26_15405 [Gemmatimonadota bacterium]|nr:hypothetical protein [Gemmatimonadota bacterium]
MSIEERLRATMRKVVGDVEPASSALDEIEGLLANRRTGSNALLRSLTILLALLVSTGTFGWLWLAFHPTSENERSIAGTTNVRPSVIATIELGGPPRAIAASSLGTWVVVGAPEGTSNDQLVEIDQSTNDVGLRVSLPGTATYLVEGSGSIWVSVAENAGTRLLRIDPTTGSTIASIPLDGEVRAAGAGAVWAVGAFHRDRAAVILKIDPATNSVAATISLPEGPNTATAIAVDGNVVWALESDVVSDVVGSSQLVRIDPETERVIGTIDVRAEPDLLVAAAGNVWAAGSGTAIHVDERSGTNEVLPLTFPGGFAPFAAASEGVWFIGSDTLDVSGEEGMASVSHLDSTTGSVDGSVNISEGVASAVPPSASLDPAGDIWVAGIHTSVMRVSL